MIKRMLHIYCDVCKAEGPCIEGEKRPALLQDVVKLGWQITPTCQHICMECVKSVNKLPLTVDVVDTSKLQITFKDKPKGEDRSRHWTEARMEKP